MKYEEKTMYQSLLCLKSLSATSPSRITWPSFFEKYLEDYGEVDERSLAYHVKHAADLGLVTEHLHMTPSVGGVLLNPLVQGHIVGLTLKGDTYAKNKFWKYILWFSRKFAAFIWIILATFIGGLLAKYIDEIVLWFS